MAQNRSHAVMAQRAEPTDSLDDFPTPPWATRAFCEHVLPRTTGFVAGHYSVLEPACNRGWMAEALRPYFRTVLARDIFDYGYGEVSDFLNPAGDLFMPPATNQRVHWCITNPPFVAAEKFVHRGLAIAEIGVAILARTNFLEGGGRYERLFFFFSVTIRRPG